MTPEINKIKEELNSEMKAAMEHLDNELTKIRAGKANPSMLSSVSVDYYGTNTPLSQVASISSPDARSLMIKPWEKNLLEEIEKSIFASNLGFTPQNDGETIRINIPALTEERRKELAKQVKAEGENAKISLRNCRKQGLDNIKKIESLSEDLARDASDDIQKITNSFGDKVDKFVLAKENEIMSF